MQMEPKMGACKRRIWASSNKVQRHISHVIIQCAAILLIKHSTGDIFLTTRKNLIIKLSPKIKLFLLASSFA